METCASGRDEVQVVGVNPKATYSMEVNRDKATVRRKAYII